MEGSSTATNTDSVECLVEGSAKMVESDAQQQLVAAPPVPESEESTTTNPEPGLESTPPNLSSLPLPGPSSSSSSPSSSSLSPVSSGDAAPALSMEEAAAQDAAATAEELASSGQSSSQAGGGGASSGDGTDAAGEAKDVAAAAVTVEEKRVGCAHYKRRAKFVTPCCNKTYMCRYCHDENESHYFNRKTVTQLICTECDTRQRVQAECEKCGVRFGKYTCLVCNLFDDEDKKQYHCDGCGICRVGGKDRFFHCEVCNMCLPMQLKIDGHRCVENVSRSNCPVCLEDIHTSRIPCHIPDCGHLLHRTCFEELLSSGHYACPTCQTSMIDMKKLWDYLDAEVASTPMPPEYANYLVGILCKDCHKESNIPYHVVGLKCDHCGAYNTCQTNRMQPPPPQPPPPTQE